MADRFAMRAAAIASTLAVAGLLATGATAGVSSPKGKRLMRQGAHVEMRHPRFAIGRIVHRRDAGGPAYYRPGYIYMPAKGIVDEACNLPTSACPNVMRDVR
jgi:hypothetical protein